MTEASKSFKASLPALHPNVSLETLTHITHTQTRSNVIGGVGRRSIDRLMSIAAVAAATFFPTFRELKSHLYSRTVRSLLLIEKENETTAIVYFINSIIKA